MGPIIVDGGRKLNQDAGIGRDMFVVRWAHVLSAPVLAKQNNHVNERMNELGEDRW